MKNYKIIFLNQVTGPLFRQLVEDVANSLGLCLLITGNDALYLKPQEVNLEIKMAPNYNRSTIFLRLKTWILFFLSALVQVYRSDKRSLLFIVSNPPFLALIGYLFLILRKQPYAILIYDLYPGLLVGLGKLTKSGLLEKIWLLFNRLVWDRSEVIFTIGEHMAQNISTIMKGSSRQPSIVVIPNWADGNVIFPRLKINNWFAEKYGLQNKLTILYSGNIGETHNLGILLSAAQLLEHEDKIHFMIIGGGARLNDLMGQAMMCSNVTILPFQPERDLPFTLTSADVAVITLESGVEGFLLPSKTYYALAAGSALLVVSYGSNELTDLVEKFRCGIAVQPDCVSSIVRAIRKFNEDADFLESCKRNSRDAMENYFSRNNTAQYIEKIEKYVFK